MIIIPIYDKVKRRQSKVSNVLKVASAKSGGCIEGVEGVTKVWRRAQSNNNKNINKKNNNKNNNT